MSLKEEVELLKRVPMFSKIATANLKLLAFASERLCYDTQDVLFEQGSQGDSAYIIIGGAVEVVINSPTGPVVVATLGENQIVGEIAILCDIPRTATVRAAEPLTTLRISKDVFLKLSIEFPHMALEVMKEIGNRLETTTARLSEAMSAA